MKIFLSHSSQDKWIASRISRELQERGFETFLDAKDIQTGDAIDESIRSHLRDCDEILMLLSPPALASPWVLIEIGGAMALGIRLVPILLHVGANELPQPLGKGLARDLNDIERYYEELSSRAEGELAPEPLLGRSSKRSLPSPRDWRAGDRVRIPAVPQPEFVSGAGYVTINWTPEMDEYTGQTATVTEADDDRSVLLDIDDGDHWWAMDWLGPAD